MDQSQDMTSAETIGDDDMPMDTALRPVTMGDFIGQVEIIENLTVYIGAAKNRGQAVDHILLQGPPGLGKTTLARIVANEMEGRFVSASAPAIGKPGDLASILMGLGQGSVLFLDEIHRLNKVAAEMLYTAMEDFRIDVLVGEGAGARTMSIDLPMFTLVGATTRAGMLPSPLLDRFGINFTLDFYTPEELARIVARDATLQSIEGESDAFFEIARRARGTPRIAKRILRRVRDF